MTVPGKPAFSRRRWLAVAANRATRPTIGAPPPAEAAATRVDRGAHLYNIRDFGAKGDGVTLDTAALQAAIDACHRDAGGTVLVPAGVFPIATVELKSQVTLHLAARGTLLGTADGKRYRAAEAIPRRGEHTMGDGNVAMIFAANAENVAIEGKGTIDGQGAQFRSRVRGEMPPAGTRGSQRPHHVIFYQCRNVVVRDVFLTASAYHSIRVCLCTHVRIDGIRIHSRVNGNNDGLHIISSQFAHVSNCVIECQDDACALFGSCKFVTVTNCTFSTRWSVFRFGTGHAENIAVSNCVIYGTWGCPIKMRCDSRSRYENISFSNLVLQDVTGPISIGLGPQHPRPGAPSEKPGTVRNIAFHNIHAVVAKPRPLPETDIGSRFNPGEVFSCIVLNGMDAGFLENISFHGVHVEFPGGGTAEHAAVREVPKIAAEYYAIGVPPSYGLFARNVRGLTLHDVTFTLASPDRRPALVFDHVSDAAINGLSVDAHPEAESALRLVASREVLLTRPRVVSPAAAFLQVEGAGCERISVEGGDIAKAAKPLAATRGASVDSVKWRL